MHIWSLAVILLATEAFICIWSGIVCTAPRRRCFLAVDYQLLITSSMVCWHERSPILSSPLVLDTAQNRFSSPRPLTLAALLKHFPKMLPPTLSADWYVHARCFRTVVYDDSASCLQMVGPNVKAFATAAATNTETFARKVEALGKHPNFTN